MPEMIWKKMEQGWSVDSTRDRFDPRLRPVLIRQPLKWPQALPYLLTRHMKNRLANGVDAQAFNILSFSHLG